MTFPSDLREAALAYVAHGWHVFPLMPSGKTPVTKNGCLDAPKFTPLVIDAWWRQNPMCNVGLATGDPFDVVDVDGPIGDATIAGALGDDYVHPGPAVTTGRGRHLYFATLNLRNSANQDLKVDVRGHNGYVVAPPSVHPDGHRYTWTTPFDSPLPDLPDELWSVLNPARYHEPDKAELFANTFLSRNLDLRALLDAKYHRSIRWHRVGNLWRAACPIGNHDTNPSFTVYQDGHFHCFGCGAHGWAHQLVEKGSHHE